MVMQRHGWAKLLAIVLVFACISDVARALSPTLGERGAGSRYAGLSQEELHERFDKGTTVYGGAGQVLNESEISDDDLFSLELYKKDLGLSDESISDATHRVYKQYPLNASLRGKSLVRTFLRGEVKTHPDFFEIEAGLDSHLSHVAKPLNALSRTGALTLISKHMSENFHRAQAANGEYTFDVASEQSSAEDLEEVDDADLPFHEAHGLLSDVDEYTFLKHSGNMQDLAKQGLVPEGGDARDGVFTATCVFMHRHSKSIKVGSVFGIATGLYKITAINSPSGAKAWSPGQLPQCTKDSLPYHLRVKNADLEDAVKDATVHVEVTDVSDLIKDVETGKVQDRSVAARRNEQVQILRDMVKDHAAVATANKHDEAAHEALQKVSEAVRRISDQDPSSTQLQALSQEYGEKLSGAAREYFDKHREYVVEAARLVAHGLAEAKAAGTDIDDAEFGFTSESEDVDSSVEELADAGLDDELKDEFPTDDENAIALADDDADDADEEVEDFWGWTKKLIAPFRSAFDSLSNELKGAWNRLTSAFNNLVNLIGNKLNELKSALNNLVEAAAALTSKLMSKLTTFATEMIAKAKNIAATAIQVATTVASAVAQVAQSIGTALVQVGKVIGQMAKFAWDMLNGGTAELNIDEVFPGVGFKIKEYDLNKSKSKSTKKEEESTKQKVQKLIDNKEKAKKALKKLMTKKEKKRKRRRNRKKKKKNKKNKKAKRGDVTVTVDIVLRILEAKAEVSPTFTLAIKIVKFKPKRIKFALGAKLTTKIDLFAQVTGILNWEKDRKAMQKPIVTFNFQIGPVPVVIVIMGQLNVGASFTLQAGFQFKVEASLEASLKLGLEALFENGKLALKPVFEKSIRLHRNGPHGFRPCASISLEITVTPKISALLYSLAGPSFALQIFAVAEFQPQGAAACISVSDDQYELEEPTEAEKAHNKGVAEKNTLTLSAGLRPLVGAKISIIGIDLVDQEIQITEFKKKLAEFDWKLPSKDQINAMTAKAEANADDVLDKNSDVARSRLSLVEQIPTDMLAMLPSIRDSSDVLGWASPEPMSALAERNMRQADADDEELVEDLALWPMLPVHSFSDVGDASGFMIRGQHADEFGRHPLSEESKKELRNTNLFVFHSFKNAKEYRESVNGEEDYRWTLVERDTGAEVDEALIDNALERTFSHFGDVDLNMKLARDNGIKYNPYAEKDEPVITEAIGSTHMKKQRLALRKELFDNRLRLAISRKLMEHALTQKKDDILHRRYVSMSNHRLRSLRSAEGVRLLDLKMMPVSTFEQMREATETRLKGYSKMVEVLRDEIKQYEDKYDAEFAKVKADRDYLEQHKNHRDISRLIEERKGRMKSNAKKAEDAEVKAAEKGRWVTEVLMKENDDREQMELCTTITAVRGEKKGEYDIKQAMLGMFNTPEMRNLRKEARKALRDRGLAIADLRRLKDLHVSKARREQMLGLVRSILIKTRVILDEYWAELQKVVRKAQEKNIKAPVDGVLKVHSPTQRLDAERELTVKSLKRCSEHKWHLGPGASVRCPRGAIITGLLKNRGTRLESLNGADCCTHAHASREITFRGSFNEHWYHCHRVGYGIAGFLRKQGGCHGVMCLEGLQCVDGLDTGKCIVIKLKIGQTSRSVSCPFGYGLQALHRTNRSHHGELDTVDHIKCCQLRDVGPPEGAVSCQVGNWYSSFDRAGMSSCPAGTSVHSLETTGGALVNLERANCCTRNIKNDLDAFVEVHSKMSVKGWKSCPAGYSVSGLQRGNSHSLTGIEMLKCTLNTYKDDCEVVSLEHGLGRRGTHSCPAGFGLNGFYRHNDGANGHLGDLTKLKCCRYIAETVEKPTTLSFAADWGNTMGKTISTQAKCKSGYIVQSLTTSGGTNLRDIKGAVCEKNRKQQTPKQVWLWWWEYLRAGGWATCPKGYGVSGFQRYHCHTLDCIQKARCTYGLSNECKLVRVDLKKKGEHGCPVGWGLQAIHRAGPVSTGNLGMVDHYKCCKYTEKPEDPKALVVASTVHWHHHMSKAGKAECPTSTIASGVTTYGCTGLNCIKDARCGKSNYVQGLPPSKWFKWNHALHAGGWVNCPSGHGISGLERSGCNHLTCIVNVKCTAGLSKTRCINVRALWGVHGTWRCPPGLAIQGLHKNGAGTGDLRSIDHYTCCEYANAQEGNNPQWKENMSAAKRHLERIAKRFKRF